MRFRDVARPLALALVCPALALAAVSGEAGLDVATEAHQIVIEQRLPEVAMQAAAADAAALAPLGHEPLTLEVAGFRRSVTPGLPALPSRVLMLAVPPGATAKLEVDTDAARTLSGVWIAPPSTTRIDDGEGDEPIFAIEPDLDVYGTDAFVPAEVAGSRRAARRATSTSCASS